MEMSGSTRVNNLMPVFVEIPESRRILNQIILLMSGLITWALFFSIQTPGQRWANETRYRKMVEEQSSPEMCVVDRERSTSHKHVPHREKPPQLVARRNARERRRVQAVNSAFCRLRRAVPIDGHRSVGRWIQVTFWRKSGNCFKKGAPPRRIFCS